MSKKEYLKILKPKTRPVQIEPWFFRYLNEGQLKVLSAIIAHADYATRQKDSFASNKTIAFYAGFGLITPGTKAYEKYQALDPEQQKEFKKKREKNAIQTVKNIKNELETLGVIKREIIESRSFAVVDLEWGKERYLKEFDEYFNDKEIKPQNNREIKDEIASISELVNEGNISDKNLVERLENITDHIITNSDQIKENIDIPQEDISLLADYIISTDKNQKRINMGEIKNASSWKIKISKLIEQNKFNGVENYYNQLHKNEIDLIKNLMDQIINITDFKQNINGDKCQILFDEEHKLFKIKFENKDNKNMLKILNSNDILNIKQLLNEKDIRTSSKLKKIFRDHKKNELRFRNKEGPPDA